MDVDPNEFAEISANIASVRARIEASQAIRTNDRDLPVQLIGVTKYQPLSKLRAAFAAGLGDFGENYAQEFREKYENWPHQGECSQPKWHFIGALQSNKVNVICGKACVHSLDRESLLSKFQARAAELEIVQQVFVQVNMGEKQKSGVVFEQLQGLLDRFRLTPNLKCIGLMAMPPFGSTEQSRKYFVKLRGLRDSEREILRENVDLTHLSMGMSRDFEVAIEEGATMVRVGTAIFGARSPN